MPGNIKRTENTIDTVSLKQPLMSTGTTEPGFKGNPEDHKKAAAPKIGETLMGDDGITGRIR